MSDPFHILVFEPRTEGHHPKWAGLVANALHASGNKVTLAVGEPEKVKPHLQDAFEPAVHTLGNVDGLDELDAAAELLEKVNADEVFWTSLDNFASKLLRKAVVGGKPPHALRGKVSGVYHRPRPIDPTESGVKVALKRRGFGKLHVRGWWGRIAVLDPLVANAAKRDYSGLTVGLVPDPAEFKTLPSKAEARQALGIPDDKIVLLHFGVFAKRKGLGLLLDALDACPMKEDFFLLRAGRAPADDADIQRVHNLSEKNLALSLDEYVDTETEAQLYAAANVVTLPYHAHYGSANLLSAAAAARRPVLSSDHHLVGRITQGGKLGWTFYDGNVENLADTLCILTETFKATDAPFAEGLEQYAKLCDHTAFSQAIGNLYKH